MRQNRKLAAAAVAAVAAAVTAAAAVAEAAAAMAAAVAATAAALVNRAGRVRFSLTVSDRCPNSIFSGADPLIQTNFPRRRTHDTSTSDNGAPPRSRRTLQPVRAGGGRSGLFERYRGRATRVRRRKPRQICRRIYLPHRRRHLQEACGGSFHLFVRIRIRRSG